MIRKKGFTLVELIVSIVILSMVLGVIWSFFMYNLRLYNLSQESAQIQFQTRQASDYIVNELQFASEVSLTNPVSKQIDQTTLSTLFPSVKYVSFELIPSNTNDLLRIRLIGSNDKPNNDYQLETVITLKKIKNSPSSEADIIYYSHNN